MKISYIDTCNSQYFSGSSKPVVQVMVDGNTTFSDIKDGLQSDENTSHLDYLFEENNWSWEDYNEAVEEWFLGFTALFPKKLTDVKWDDSLEILDENTEDAEHYDCYSYFVIETEK